MRFTRARRGMVLGCLLLARPAWTAERLVSPPVVEAEWRSDELPGQPVTRWWFENGDYRLSWTAAEARKPCWLRRAAALPAGDWTVDVWLAQASNMGYQLDGLIALDAATGGRLTEIQLGAESGRAQVHARDLRQGAGGPFLAYDYVEAGAGPLHWVRLSYDDASQKLTMQLNGQTVKLHEHALGLAGARLSVGASARYAQNKKPAMHLFAFGVQPKLLKPVATLRGLAFTGWATTPKLADAARAELSATRDKLRARATDDKLDPAVRGYALAALLAADRALDGLVAPASWAQVAPAVAQLDRANRLAAATLLPVAAACGDGAQRGELAALLPAHFASLADRNLLPRDDARQHVVRGALLDPLQAARCPVTSLGMRESLALADELADDAPVEATMMLARLLHGQHHTPSALVWLLPRWQAVSPTYADGVLRLVRDWADHNDRFLVDEPDRTQALLAWRLGDYDLPGALGVIAEMRKPTYQLEAVEAITPKLAALHDNTGLQLAEKCLQAVIDGFKPTRRDDSAAPHHVRLAQFYFGHDRRNDALAQLARAQAIKAERPENRFRDALAIARLMAEQKLPDASVWLSAAVNAAAEADAGKHDNPGGGFYLSSTSTVVQELVGLGQIDRALAVARGLKHEGGLNDNLALAMSSVVFAVVKTDVRRAVELLAEVPDSPQLPTTLMAVAKALAPLDLPAALKLLDRLPAERRPVASYAVCRAAGAPFSVTDLARLGEATAVVVDGFKKRPDRWGLRGVLKDLDSLPLPQVWGLEPSFGDDAVLFHRQVLESVLAAAGWNSDPLWKRQATLDAFTGWSIPWGASRLKDMIRATQQNEASDAARN
jgi:hypothetical protein